MTKYRAKKVQADGYTFDSKAEFARYCELKVQERAGEIAHLTIHPKYVLDVGGEKVGSYTPDFRYYRSGFGAPVIEDVKGVMTRDASLRIRLFQVCYGIDVSIIGKAAKPRKFKRAA